MIPRRRFRFTPGASLIAIALIAVGLAVLRPLRATKITDVTVGTGPAAQVGDTLVVHYVGTLFNGKVFDSSKGRNVPFEFVLGDGQVIKGWDVGMVGMRVGGVRKLAIPPGEAYGDPGVPPTIPPRSPLYFKVELLGIK